MRFYGFDVAEIVDDSAMLPLDIDPKLAWALRNPDRFPVDLNTAPKELLLRVPGLGTKNVGKILASRRHKALPFIILSDHRPAPHHLDATGLIERFKPKATQLRFGF